MDRTLPGCARGKHEFGRWYNGKDTRPKVDEFFRFRCFTCGCWMFRSTLSTYDVQELRKYKGRVKWEVSSAEDAEARRALAAQKLEALGGPPSTNGVDSGRSPGVDSSLPAGSAGAYSPRSPGVRSAGSRRGRGKAVRRG